MSAIVYQPAGAPMVDHYLHDRLPMGRKFASQDAANVLLRSAGVEIDVLVGWCGPATFHSRGRNLTRGYKQNGIDVSQ